MNEWHRILKKVSTYGEDRPDRTGIGTRSLFGEQLTFDNRVSFPAVTTKRLAFEQVKAELACFLRGYDNLAYFHKMGCSIWDGNGNADYWQARKRSEGDLGRIYGVQWRDWRGVLLNEHGGIELRRIDQLQKLVEGLIDDPWSRRHIVTVLNPAELPQMCLPPCHVLFQCYMAGGVGRGRVADRRLDMRVDMRSVDLFLGLPFDIASYALLQRLLAKEVNAVSGWLTFQLGDAHVYLNHEPQVATVLAREEQNPPWLWLDSQAGLFDFEPKHAELRDYKPHPAVPAPLNV